MWSTTSLKIQRLTTKQMLHSMMVSFKNKREYSRLWPPEKCNKNKQQFWGCISCVLCKLYEKKSPNVCLEESLWPGQSSPAELHHTSSWKKNPSISSSESWAGPAVYWGDYVMWHEQKHLNLHNAQWVRLPPTTQNESIHNSQQTQFLIYKWEPGGNRFQQRR